MPTTRNQLHAFAAVERTRRGPLGLLAARIVPVLVALFWGFSGVAHAGLSQRSAPEPRRVTLQLTTDMLAYDLCWSDNAAANRQRLADLAAGQLGAPGSRNVLLLPQLPATFQPLVTPRAKDADGRLIDRSRAARGRATYASDVETALLDVLARIRQNRPGVKLSVDGYRPQERLRGVAYGELRRSMDFAYADEDLTSRLRHSDQRRDVDWQVNQLESWLRSLGLADGRNLLIRAGDAWIEVSTQDLAPETQDSAATEDTTPAGRSTTGDGAQTDDARSNVDTTQRPAPPTARSTAAPANPDINGDGVVNSADRAMLIGAWGTNDARCDLNHDGVVNAGDLAVLLGAFNNDPAPVVQGSFQGQDYYVKGSGQDITFVITAGAPDGVNVVFQIQPEAAGAAPTVQWDGAAPFTIPWHLLNSVATGRASVQAMVRDRNFTVVGTITKQMVFLESAPQAAQAPPAPPAEQPQGGAAPAPQPGDQEPRSPVAGPMSMGMNLAPLTYYTREWIFTDVFKIAMPWITQNDHYVGDGSDAWDTGKANLVQYDSNGYPLSMPLTVPGRSAPQAVASLMYRDCGGRYPAGEYVCLYDGVGRIEFGFDASIVSQTTTPTGGRMVVRVTPSDAGILLKITQSSAANHVRNIRLIMPGFEDVYQTQLFHPMFLQRLSAFKVLRFMDWQRTNDSQNKDWANRTTGTWFTQADDRGASVEAMVALANAAQSDPWFCMPHMATDDYVRRFAQLVKNSLDPSRKVYVEYSNEVWNGQFQQYHWVAHAGFGQDSSPGNYAFRAGQMFNIWREVFGDQRDRVVRVCLGQHLNPWVLEAAMQTLNGNVDAAGCAAYFGPATPPGGFSRTTTGADLIPLCKQWIRDEALPKLRANAAIAARWNVPFITYEGGQHMTAYGNPNLPELQALLDVQYNPAIYDCYMDLLRGLRDMNCQLFTAFNFVSSRSQWGSWGHLEYQDQSPTQAHKYRALLDAAAGRIPDAPSN